MPEISRFLGIIILMYYNDHSPPHFHVKYNDFRSMISINELKITEGNLPKRVISLVLEWAFEHREELLENWNFAVSKAPLRKIEPLV